MEIFDLGKDMICEIMEFLVDPYDYLMFASSCKYINNIYQDNRLKKNYGLKCDDDTILSILNTKQLRIFKILKYPTYLIRKIPNANIKTNEHYMQDITQIMKKYALKINNKILLGEFCIQRSDTNVSNISKLYADYDGSLYILGEIYINGDITYITGDKIKFIQQDRRYSYDYLLNNTKSRKVIFNNSAHYYIKEKKKLMNVLLEFKDGQTKCIQFISKKLVFNMTDNNFNYTLHEYNKTTKISRYNWQVSNIRAISDLNINSSIVSDKVQHKFVSELDTCNPLDTCQLYSVKIYKHNKLLEETISKLEFSYIVSDDDLRILSREDYLKIEYTKNQAIYNDYINNIRYITSKKDLLLITIFDSCLKVMEITFNKKHKLVSCYIIQNYNTYMNKILKIPSKIQLKLFEYLSYIKPNIYSYTHIT